MSVLTEMESLKEQLKVARKEIKNLRKQITTLNYTQKKEIESVRQVLSDFKCQNCRNLAENAQNNAIQEDLETTTSQDIKFSPIGTIKTPFPEKRGVPRQASISTQIEGVIDLTFDTFNNPEHSLEGLEDFSHIWVIYYFHKNPCHAKAKVAPPRLEGNRIGVFSSRSPHRPCPLGLSLVEVTKIEGSRIFFRGIDMVDGSPVFDIKPYVPQYDTPSKEISHPEYFDLEFINAREAPDGQETTCDSLASTSQAVSNKPMVRVPNWVSNANTLSVSFSDKAIEQMTELNVKSESVRQLIASDPRSAYLRTKHKSQIFSFQFSEATITAKFDDAHNSVTVVQVRKTQSTL
ncbi:tRNA (adenine(37)-N6)-methyltransferase-like [Phlebotomus argentipes]|uniref:tRNA (adenine(37)-N6)-methyltransferase-like n=1 Tax=Phlebotomus argentipes TaxID=94469 RepID=UPI00289379C5|nr:tRNA (adenine(37)-N6)-methyltransferase-like [Phlebotomus argentipes]